MSSIHDCPHCGKPTTNPVYCSRLCNYDAARDAYRPTGAFGTMLFEDFVMRQCGRSMYEAARRLCISRRWVTEICSGRVPHWDMAAIIINIAFKSSECLISEWKAAYLQTVDEAMGGLPAAKRGFRRKAPAARECIECHRNVPPSSRAKTCSDECRRTRHLAAVKRSRKILVAA